MSRRNSASTALCWTDRLPAAQPRNDCRRTPRIWDGRGETAKKSLCAWRVAWARWYNRGRRDPGLVSGLCHLGECRPKDSSDRAYIPVQGVISEERIGPRLRGACVHR